MRFGFGGHHEKKDHDWEKNEKLSGQPPREHTIRLGDHRRLGAVLHADGVNFCIFSWHAARDDLLLFETATSTEPFQVITLHHRQHRTYFFWHVFVERLGAGTCYAWRLDGQHDTHLSGFRFDVDKVLLDPWTRGVSVDLWNRKQALHAGDNAATAMRSVVVDDAYDWEEVTAPAYQQEEAIIYELHVGGFTRHASSGVDQPGTFHALIDRIPYLVELGITHVELLPVMAFDEQDVPKGVAARGHSNYWGYSTHSFYSPHPGYCTSTDAATHAREFRDMVKAFHRAGIGVILDVVFNHTAEGGQKGPLINFKGMANEVFYHLDPHDRRSYRDFTGCGNTVNANHPLVSRFIIECLEYWARDMHVDGFRFDLASALCRGEHGQPLYHAPVLWGIEYSEVLADTLIIAEPWDAAGLYQVGSFPGFRWGEWNGRYRDVMRRFVRGDGGLINDVASRLSGSSDLYQGYDRLPANSINFITSHDGFPLIDLVSYNDKHNEANGEKNRDGESNNLSRNYGIEGDTDDADIVAVRQRQSRNFLTLLFLSQGIPMMLAGDEVLRSQQGNNNAYCQDNELSWFDWRLVEENRDMLDFVRAVIAFRRRHPCLRQRRFLTGRERRGHHLVDVAWHGEELDAPPWSDSGAQVLALTLAAVIPDEEDLHVIMNMSAEPVSFLLPESEDRQWYLAIDTFAAEVMAPVVQNRYERADCTVESYSVIVFEAR